MQNMQPTIIIAGTGTAVPSHVVRQADVRAIVEPLFAESVSGLDRLLEVFDHTHIHTRHFVCPPEWYGRDHSWSEATDVYRDAAIRLSVQAATQALERASCDAEEVAGVVAVSSTGIMTPSLDSHVARALGLRPTVKRLPIFGLGCAGGVAGVARAAELSRALQGKPVLMVAVEICTATFQRRDISKSNVIATSLFADGAGAVVVRADTNGPVVCESFSALFPDTEDMMGWDVTDDGLRVRFARSIPAFIEEHLPIVLQQACAAWDIEPSQVQTYITHPGGQKVLDAFADAVGCQRASLAHSYNVLRDFGNMSAASVLFVLHAILTDQAHHEGYGLMSALGPGFSAEQLLLRFPGTST